MTKPQYKPRGHHVKIDWQKCREIAIAEIGKNPWASCHELALLMGVSAFTACKVANKLKSEGLVDWKSAKRPGAIEHGLEKLYSGAVFGQRFTLEEMAQACGVTRNAIHQIELSALKKLRRRLTKEDASALLGFLRGN